MSSKKATAKPAARKRSRVVGRKGEARISETGQERGLDLRAKDYMMTPVYISRAELMEWRRITMSDSFCAAIRMLGRIGAEVYKRRMGDLAFAGAVNDGGLEQVDAPEKIARVVGSRGGR